MLSSAVLGKRNWFLRRGRLDGNQGRHNLGDAGRIKLLVDVFGIKNLLGVQIHKDAGLRINRRSLGPAASVSVWTAS